MAVRSSFLRSLLPPNAHLLHGVVAAYPTSSTLAARSARALRRSLNRSLQESTVPTQQEMAALPPTAPQAPGLLAPPTVVAAPTAPAGTAYTPLVYTGLPQKPPKLDVSLDTCNYDDWIEAVYSYARIRNCMQAIQGLPNVPQEMEDEILQVVKVSIPPEALIDGLSPSVLRLSTHNLLNAIQTFCTATYTVDSHENLRRQAQDATIDRNEAVDDYIKRHQKIRLSMLHYQVPGIQDERITVNHIVQGLRTRTTLRAHIQTIRVARHQTIRSLHMHLREISDDEDRFYSERQAKGRGRGGRGRGATSYGSVHDTRSKGTTMVAGSDSSAAGSSASRGRGRGRGGRGRGRGRSTKQANAVMESESGKQDDDEDDDYMSQSQPPASASQDNDNVNAQFTSYTLDSAAYPTYLREADAPSSSSSLSTSSATLPDGSKVTVADVPELLLQTRSGSTLKLQNVCSAKFRENLLSIAQITEQNNCHVIFRRNHAIFVDDSTSNRRRRILARAPRRGSRYVIRLKNITPPGQSASAITPRRTYAPRPDALAQPKPQKPPATRAFIANTHTRAIRSTPVSSHTTPRAPYLPTPRAEQTTNAVPYPSHLPNVRAKEKTITDAYYNWHLRLNHAPLPLLHKMAARPESGLPTELLQPPPPMTCSGCNLGHHYRSSHKSTTQRPPIGHTIATDLAGPLAKTKEGHQYILTVTELHSRMRFISLLRSKADTPRVLLATIAQIERHTGVPVTRVRSDNANEYLTKEVLETTRARGSTIDPTVPHTPQQNSIAERLNRTILERVRATLASMQMPFDKYWALCALNTIEKLNVTHQMTIDDIPRRLWEACRTDHSPFYPRFTRALLTSGSSECLASTGTSPVYRISRRSPSPALYWSATYRLRARASSRSLTPRLGNYSSAVLLTTGRTTLRSIRSASSLTLSHSRRLTVRALTRTMQFPTMLLCSSIRRHHLTTLTLSLLYLNQNRLVMPTRLSRHLLLVYPWPLPCLRRLPTYQLPAVTSTRASSDRPTQKKSSVSQRLIRLSPLIREHYREIV